MQPAVVTPVLLWLLASEVKPSHVSRALKVMESYLVRRMLCCMTKRGYTKVFVDLFRKFQQVVQHERAIR